MTVSGGSTELTFDETLEFLEAKEATATEPARAAAVFMSAESWKNIKTSIEIMCRKMGKACDYQTRAWIKNLP